MSAINFGPTNTFGPSVRRIYIARMTRPNAAKQRYRVWEHIGDRLALLQPPDPHMRARASLLPFQRFSIMEGYDAYHFVFDQSVTAGFALGRALAKLWCIPVAVTDLVDQAAPLTFGVDGEELTVVP